MYFTEEHMKNQTSQVLSEWDRICKFLFGKSFSKPLFRSMYLKTQKNYDEFEYLGLLRELNKMNDSVHKCLLSLQDPKHLRIEIIKSKKFVEVQIFYEDEFLVGEIHSPSNYIRGTYNKLIHRYESPKISELVHYSKMFKRDEIISELLNE